MKQRFHFPAQEAALERVARRAQVAEMSRLFGLAARKLGVLATHGAAKLSRALGRPPAAHRQSGHAGKRAVRVSVIGGIGVSLPAEIRTRYASELAAAARVEPLIDFGLVAWDLTVRVLAHAFRSGARGLRAAARSLDILARRLGPAH